jgi:hypothetical protein
MPTPNDSSSGFANAPLLALLKTPHHMMTPDQKRAYAVELRTIAKSSQSLGRKLREELGEGDAAGAAVSGGSGTGKTSRAKTLKPNEADYESFMAEMEGGGK